MSGGSAGPSTSISPLFTTCPSCAITCLSFGIRYSCATLSRSVITRRCLPLVSLPKETVPVTSASTPASLGERASKSSATRGSPPVMSRVFEISWGIRASTSPTPTSWPSRTVMIEPIWKVMLTDWSEPAILISWLASSSSFTCGRSPFASAALGIDHHQRGEPRHLVDLLGNRRAFLDVLELDAAGILGDDRAGVRVPGREHLPGLDRLAVAREKRRPVRYLVALTLAAALVVNHDLAVARDRD